MRSNRPELRETCRIVWRYTLLMPTLGVALVTFTIPALVYLWWQVMGTLALVFLRRRLGPVVGRYLGCYPFAYTVLGWGYLVALFLWAGGDRPYRHYVTKVLDTVLDALAKFPDHRKIGGIW